MKIQWAVTGRGCTVIKLGCVTTLPLSGIAVVNPVPRYDRPLRIKSLQPGFLDARKRIITPPLYNYMMKNDAVIAAEFYVIAEPRRGFAS